MVSEKRHSAEFFHRQGWGFLRDLASDCADFSAAIPARVCPAADIVVFGHTTGNENETPDRRRPAGWIRGIRVHPRPGLPLRTLRLCVYMIGSITMTSTSTSTNRTDWPSPQFPGPLQSTSDHVPRHSTSDGNIKTESGSVSGSESGSILESMPIPITIPTPMGTARYFRVSTRRVCGVRFSSKYEEKMAGGQGFEPR
jgi:hypothetical protein